MKGPIKAEIRPEEQSEKAESCRKNSWNEIIVQHKSSTKNKTNKLINKQTKWDTAVTVQIFFTIKSMNNKTFLPIQSNSCFVKNKGRRKQKRTKEAANKKERKKHKKNECINE